MTKSTVTVQEMDRVARTIGLKMYNDQAMRKICLMVRLGFDATLEMYQREERNTNEAEQRKQAAEAAEIDNWIGSGSMFETLDTIGAEREGTEHSPIISGGEILYITHPTGNDDIPF